MEYNFSGIEQKWQQHWQKTGAYRVSNQSTKPKYYVLDMFPYPSGAGLHVGHPLGYIASDIYSRYKRLQGYNVLHPMGYDAFGLPAEQYALDHGIHPAVSTDKNIATFRSQLDKIGFCYDWDREVRTCNPDYYKWTQWIFLQLFNSFFNRHTQKAEPIEVLIAAFEKEGNVGYEMPNNKFQIPTPVPQERDSNGESTNSNEEIPNSNGEIPKTAALDEDLNKQEEAFTSRSADGFVFNAEDWQAFSEATQQAILMEYRLAYCGHGEVNWCEALGTVLANDEVVNGVSERGGHPVVKKKLRQWYLRITEYADRLLQGLETIDFSDAMKEIQTNWIGKSYGANIKFSIKGSENNLEVYTTRPDTIFGVDFMVVAPEHTLVTQITTAEQQPAVEAYIAYVNSRSDRERQAEKKITGCFTGAYAINPFDGREIPIWISEYVLAGYGTGAIMAVPCGDERDFKFAQHFDDITITNIIGEHYNGKEANATKDAELTNSGFLDGMPMRKAAEIVISKLEELGIGKRKVNYKMRDAAFSRQRYWGEPFPIVWKNGIAYPLPESELPLQLPEVENYSPGPEGEGPLANLVEWSHIPFPFPEEKGAPPLDASQNTIPLRFQDKLPHIPAKSPLQYEHARTMRKNHTVAEKILWEQLRDHRLGVELKFRRQHPIDAYIVDFMCLPKRLVVEVDGEYHNNPEQKAYDEERTKVLNSLGFEVIRFSNDEVINNTKAVLKEIALKTVEFDKAKAQYNSIIGATNSAKINEKIQVDSSVTSTTNSNEVFNHEVEIEAPLSQRGRGAGGEWGMRETNTMPGYAGSSWYFLRYMDPHNDLEFCNRAISDYWNQVDLYVGGTEHAVGHLLYSRMWTKVLYDLGHIGFDEPFKKLLNQGMIQGSSRFVYRVSPFTLIYETQEDKLIVNNLFVSKAIYDNYQKKPDDLSKIINNYLCIKSQREGKMLSNYRTLTHTNDQEIQPIRIDVNIVDGYNLNINAFREINNNRYKDADIILEDYSIILAHETWNGTSYICGAEVEKMSKSKFNTVNPDDLVAKYGADTFRMYEMFLGPVELSKPWDTKGIEGVHRFVKKLWRLFYHEEKGLVATRDTPSPDELKVLHKTIKKIEDDTERFSFNTAISAFMIAVNELTELKCHKQAILEPLLVLLTPYAPHISEELWHALGHTDSVLDAAFPAFNAAYVTESSKEYPVSINGKVRTNLTLPLDAEQETVQSAVLANEVVQKWMEGKPLKKLIFVKGKMINVVC